MKVTRENVCELYGHDCRWRRVVGPMPEGVRRPAVPVCLDCGKVWEVKEGSGGDR